MAAAISTLVVSIFYLIPQMVGAGALIKPLLGIDQLLGLRVDAHHRVAQPLRRAPADAEALLDVGQGETHPRALQGQRQLQDTFGGGVAHGLSGGLKSQFTGDVRI